MASRRGVVAGFLGVLGILLVAPPVVPPASADTGGYPNAGMPCEWFPQATSGPAHTKWCQDFDWGPTPATLFAGTETVAESTTISPRGFGYRNCTDYVAYELGFDSHTVHGNAAQWKDQIPPSNVTDYPTVGSVAWWGPELFGGLGHAAVVLQLNYDGSAVVGEYNYYLDGTYDTRTISSHGTDAYLHIKDQAVAGGIAYVPGAPRPRLPPPPATQPPAPARSASPTPSSPSPAPSPAPTDQDVRNLAASALSDFGPTFVAFAPPGVMRPHASQLVEARVDRAGDLAAAINKQIVSLASQAGRVPQLHPGNLMTVTLSSPDFAIQATTPSEQALSGAGLAVWQWEVTALRPGTQTLTLCLSVDLSASSGTQHSPASCTLARSVRVTNVPAIITQANASRSAVWLIGVTLAFAAVATAVGVAWRRRRRAS